MKMNAPIRWPLSRRAYKVEFTPRRTHSLCAACGWTEDKKRRTKWHTARFVSGDRVKHMLQHKMNSNFEWSGEKKRSEVRSRAIDWRERAEGLRANERRVADEDPVVINFINLKLTIYAVRKRSF